MGDVVTLNSIEPRHRERDYDTIDDYNRFLRDLRAENSWKFFEFNPAFANPDRSLKAEYDMDGIHLKRAANDVIYEQVVGYCVERRR